jgi:hypothetical protein
MENNILLTVVILVIVFLIIFLILYLLSKYSHINKVDSEMHSYYVEKSRSGGPIIANGKNMNYCPNGCVRGACKKRRDNAKNMCTTDIQCQYCQDKVTNMFYVNL